METYEKTRDTHHFDSHTVQFLGKGDQDCGSLDESG